MQALVISFLLSFEVCLTSRNVMLKLFERKIIYILELLMHMDILVISLQNIYLQVLLKEPCTFKFSQPYDVHGKYLKTNDMIGSLFRGKLYISASN